MDRGVGRTEFSLDVSLSVHDTPWSRVHEEKFGTAKDHLKPKLSRSSKTLGVITLLGGELLIQE